MKSWIWNHAKAMKCSVSQIGPKDMSINMSRGAVYISCTIRDAYEAEAAREMIAIFAKGMTMHRKMLLADIIEPTTELSYESQLANFLGTTT